MTVKDVKATNEQKRPIAEEKPDHINPNSKRKSSIEKCPEVVFEEFKQSSNKKVHFCFLFSRTMSLRRH